MRVYAHSTASTDFFTAPQGWDVARAVCVCVCVCACVLFEYMCVCVCEDVRRTVFDVYFLNRAWGNCDVDAAMHVRAFDSVWVVCLCWSVSLAIER